MQLPDDKELKFFERHQLQPPTHEEHGVVDTWEHPLSDRLIKGNPRNWHLEGNMLSCQTDFGPLSQTIPADHILIGEDENHLPILKRLVL